MLERFLQQTHFTSQEDFIKNFKVNVPENFNFGYDVVDAWAAEDPGKQALLWTNDQGACIHFSYADLKKYTDRLSKAKPGFQELRQPRHQQHRIRT